MDFDNDRFLFVPASLQRLQALFDTSDVFINLSQSLSMICTGERFALEDLTG